MPHLKCITNFVCYLLFKSWKYNGISYFFPLVIPFNFTIQRRRLSSFCMNIFWTNGIYLLKTRTLCINVCFRVIESLYLYSLCSRYVTPTWIAKERLFSPHHKYQVVISLQAISKHSACMTVHFNEIQALATSLRVDFVMIRKKY